MCRVRKSSHDVQEKNKTEQRTVVFPESRSKGANKNDSGSRTKTELEICEQGVFAVSYDRQAKLEPVALKFAYQGLHEHT